MLQDDINAWSQSNEMSIMKLTLTIQAKCGSATTAATPVVVKNSAFSVVCKQNILG